MFGDIEFLNREFFWLFLLLPLALLWYVFKSKKQTAELKISTVHGFKVSNSMWSILRHLLFVLRLVALA